MAAAADSTAPNGIRDRLRLAGLAAYPDQASPDAKREAAAVAEQRMVSEIESTAAEEAAAATAAMTTSEWLVSWITRSDPHEPATVLSNRRVPCRMPDGSKRHREIDAIIVARHSITCVEIKNWSGTIEATGPSAESSPWRQIRRNGDSLQHDNPIVELGHKVTALRDFLSSAGGGGGDTVGGVCLPETLPIRSCVAFVNANAVLRPSLADHPLVMAPGSWSELLSGPPPPPSSPPRGPSAGAETQHAVEGGDGGVREERGSTGMLTQAAQAAAGAVLPERWAWWKPVTEPAPVDAVDGAGSGAGIAGGPPPPPLPPSLRSHLPGCTTLTPAQLAFVITSVESLPTWDVLSLHGGRRLYGRLTGFSSETDSFRQGDQPVGRHAWNRSFVKSLTFHHQRGETDGAAVMKALWTSRIYVHALMGYEPVVRMTPQLRSLCEQEGGSGAAGRSPAAMVPPASPVRLEIPISVCAVWKSPGSSATQFYALNEVVSIELSR